MCSATYEVLVCVFRISFMYFDNSAISNSIYLCCPPLVLFGGFCFAPVSRSDCSCYASLQKGGVHALSDKLLLSVPCAALPKCSARMNNVMYQHVTLLHVCTAALRSFRTDMYNVGPLMPWSADENFKM